jgi:1-phosphofructokinase family hexose kinase
MIRVVCPNPAWDRTLLLDNWTPYAVNRAVAIHDYLGGKGYNVARTIRRLGQPVVVFTFLGGWIGELLKEMSRREGIEDRSIRINGQTRIYTILADTQGGNVTLINEPGPAVSLEECHQLIDQLENETKSEDWIICSGSLPEGVPSSFYAEIIRRLGKKAKVSVDTSGKALKETLQANPWMVKINLDEFREVSSEPVDPSDPLSILHSLNRMAPTIPHIGVTLGANGLIWKAETTAWYIHVPKVKAANPTASGDTFLGGLAVQLDQGANWEDALRFATACAVANSMSWLPEIPEDTDLDRIKEQIQVETIAVKGGEIV